MAQSGTGPSLLDMPPRPPTPPRKGNKEDEGAFEPRSSMLSGLTRILSMASGSRTSPHESPESSAESASRTYEKSQKRVEFKTWTEHENTSKLSNSLSTPTQQSPRPSGELKPTKSILKPYNGVPPVNRTTGNGNIAHAHTYTNFAEMLESIVRELAGEDRTMRIDAYNSLSNVLKASGNTTDPKALKGKMSLLTQFIRRDMTSKTPTGSLDTSVVNNALQLLSIFLHEPSIADTMSTEFCTFVVEHSINAFEDKAVSKDVVRRLLFTMDTQNFSPKVMNLERVGRLVQSLGKIEEHVKGKSIVLGRMAVYRRLLKQAKVPMLSKMSWLENMFTEMLSSLKEIREPAIAFGFEAALQTGHEKQGSRAAMELFSMEYNGAKYIDYLALKLTSMSRIKSECVYVPQIWSIVVLFLRHVPRQFEQWEYMNKWLLVIQECFNSGAHDVKAQANLAWNRLVFALRLDEKMGTPMDRMLSNALSLQLQRKLVGRHAKETRRTTMGSVCNLLYYALKPPCSSTRLDLYWDEFVVQLIGKILVERQQSETEQEDLAQACSIMSALFDLTPRPWNINRANEAGVVKAKELPGMDPKWIRKNSERVFLVLAPLVEKCFWDLTNDGSPIYSAWKNFVECVASAGTMEVKVSNDKMTAVAVIFGLLFKIWQRGPGSLPAASGDADSFASNFSRLITTTVSALGVLPFTEKLLSMGPQDTFAIVATPSQQPFKIRGHVLPPLHHLLVLLAQPPDNLRCDKDYANMLKVILQPFFEIRVSQWTRIELMKVLSELSPPQSPHPRASIILWQVLASFGTMAIDRTNEANISGSGSGSGSHDQPLGREYRKVVGFLVLGINKSPSILLHQWKSLFTSIAAQITREVGDSGRAVALIEPLAEALSTRPDGAAGSLSLTYFPLLLSSATYPKEKQALDASRRLLWGYNANPKLSSFDPFSHLYVYMRRCLADAYMTLENDQSEEHMEILASVAAFIQSCPKAHKISLLVNIQEGIGIWVKDDALKFRGRSSSPVSKSVAILWDAICTELKSSRMQEQDGAPVKHSELLQNFEPIVCAGLDSKHQSHVNAAIDMWNSAFGCASRLDYPPTVKESLLRLRSVADLQLPSFPEDVDDELLSDGPTFVHSQEDDLSPYLPSALDSSILAAGKDEISLPALSLLHESRRSYLEALGVPKLSARPRSRQATPERSGRKTIKKDLTPKLRHDDSQIQFAPIDSSPLDGMFIDSQLLTDRQREVKQRQSEAAAMFPDLRSSPKIKQKSGLSKSVSNSDPPDQKLVDPILPTTPLITGPDKAPFDDYVTSSPTPRRGQVDLTIDSDAIDPPSSPPERLMQDESNILNLSFVSSHRNDNNMESDMWAVTSFPSTILPEVENTANDLGPSAQIDPITFVNALFQPASTANSALVDSSGLSPLVVAVEAPKSPAAAAVLSPGRSDFVDALSSPVPESDEIFVDAASSPLALRSAPNTTMDKEQAAILAILTNDVQLPSQPSQLDAPTSPISDQILPSSPISNMDDDSILRLMKKFDHVSPQSDQRHLDSNTSHHAVDMPEITMDDNAAIADNDDNATSDVLDCIIVETTAVSGAESGTDTDGEPGLKQFLMRTRTSPMNLGNETRLMVPVVPERRGSESPEEINGAGSDLLSNSKPVDPEFISQDSAESSRKRRSIKAQGKDKREPSKRRKTFDAAAIPMTGSQEKKPTHSSPRTKLRTAAVKRWTRSSPKVKNDSQYTVQHPHSVDLDASKSESDNEAEAVASQWLGFIEDAGVSTSQTPVRGSNDVSKNSGISISTTESHLNLKPNGSAVSTSIPQTPEPSKDLDAPPSSLEVEAEAAAGNGNDSKDRKIGEEMVTASKLIGRFEEFIESMRNVPLTREEANKMDDLHWEFKAALSAAEKKGRLEG